MKRKREREFGGEDHFYSLSALYFLVWCVDGILGTLWLAWWLFVEGRGSLCCVATKQKFSDNDRAAMHRYWVLESTRPPSSRARSDIRIYNNRISELYGINSAF